MDRMDSQKEEEVSTVKTSERLKESPANQKGTDSTRVSLEHISAP